MKVMSFNARTSSLPSKKHGWENRRQLVVDIVNKYQPDVVGFQEVQQDQLADLVAGLQGYGCHHQGWQAVDHKQELLPIFFLKERVSIVKAGAFWLNTNPDLPRIDEGGGEVLRVCTWLHASCTSPLAGTGTGTKTYAIYHTHFDHQKEGRREAAARLILGKIAIQSAGIPALLFGDLNTAPGSTTYDVLRSRFLDAFVESPTPRSDDEITCHSFTGVTKRAWYRSSFRWIDHILIDKGITCTEATRVLDSLGGERHVFPSDHWPVIASII